MLDRRLADKHILQLGGIQNFWSGHIQLTYSVARDVSCQWNKACSSPGTLNNALNYLYCMSYLISCPPQLHYWKKNHLIACVIINYLLSLQLHDLNALFVLSLETLISSNSESDPDFVYFDGVTHVYNSCHGMFYC